MRKVTSETQTCRCVRIGFADMASQVPINVKVQPAAASSAALRGKKRPGSPAVSAAPQAAGNSSSKKRKGQLTTSTTQSQVAYSINPLISI